MSKQPVTVLYDGDCGICSWSRDFAEKHDAAGLLRFMPFQTAALEVLSPGLTRQQASRMAWVIEGGGTRYGGARAVFEVLSRLGGVWAALGTLAANPIISMVFTPPYLLIASQRHRISALFGMNACKLPDPSVRA